MHSFFTTTRKNFNLDTIYLPDNPPTSIFFRFFASNITTVNLPAVGTYLNEKQMSPNFSYIIPSFSNVASTPDIIVTTIQLQFDVLFILFLCKEEASQYFRDKRRCDVVYHQEVDVMTLCCPCVDLILFF